MTVPMIPTLPENAKLQYLGEGAANIVYRISIPECQPRPGTPPPAQIEEYGEGTPPPSEIEFPDQHNGDWRVFENKLLRVRKDLRTTLPCAVAQKSWSDLIEPLFSPAHLVMQSLVSLRPGSGGCSHIDTLNASLSAWEESSSSTVTISTTQEGGSRPPKRCGIYLASDQHGLLVTDMSGPDIVQFKPKWLAQSPSAPEEARRCRTCALDARKAAVTRKSLGEERAAKSEGRFCPLDLLSSDQEAVKRVADVILGPGVSAEALLRFTRWIHTTRFLRCLRDVQVLMDPTGVLAARPDDENANEKLRLAMTLRDCSVFVRLPGSGSGSGPGLAGGMGEEEDEVEARMGDLDVKSPDKLAYWQNTERALIEEGWYAGTEKDSGGANICSLGR